MAKCCGALGHPAARSMGSGARWRHLESRSTATAMKDKLLSAFRHLLTGLAGLGGFLLSKGVIAAEDAPSVDAAGDELAQAASAILAIVAMRLILFLVGKYAPGLAPLVSGAGNPIAHDKAGGGTSSGGSLVPLLLGMAVVLPVVGSLPSCRLADGYKVTGSAYYGNSDAKAGIRFEDGNVIPFGRVALRDPETGKVTGYADLQAAPKIHATK